MGMPKRLDAPQMRRSHCEAISSPPPTQAPWIIATVGCRHRAIEIIVDSITVPYFFASFAFLRVVSNSEISAPAAKAFSPAPRMTTQRSDASASSSRIASPSRCQEPRPSALSLPGLLSVTVAMSPARARRISPDIACLRGLGESALHPADRRGNHRPEEQYERERADRAHQAVRPEHAHIAPRTYHRQAEGVLGAVAEDQRERERRERDRDFLEHVADHSEGKHQPDV